MFLDSLRSIRDSRYRTNLACLLGFLLVTGSCHRDPLNEVQGRGTISGVQTTSVSPTAGPDSQLSRFLEQMIATRRPTQAGLDSVFLMADEGDWVSDYWLADYEVIQASDLGDSAIVTAALTTAARESPDPTFVPSDTGPSSRALAELAVRTDTAAFRLAKRDSRWVVLGNGRWVNPNRDPSYPRVDLFRSAKIYKWRPIGASIESAVAVVDSIRKARGHRIVR